MKLDSIRYAAGRGGWGVSVSTIAHFGLVIMEEY